MQTRLVYYDESGDDGPTTDSSSCFVLSGICIEAEDWRMTLERIQQFRKELKKKYNFPVAMELHTKEFFWGQEPYWSYPHKWLAQEKLAILQSFCTLICSLDVQLINVIYDKEKAPVPLKKGDILEAVLKESIAALEWQCRCEKAWNYILISDKGRLGAMRNATKKIPNRYMIEDVFEKDSIDSFFIQLCDYIACFTRLYYNHCLGGKPISQNYTRVTSAAVIQEIFAQLEKESLCQLVVVPK